MSSDLHSQDTSNADTASFRSDVFWLALFIPLEIGLLSLAFFGYVFCRSDLKLLFYPWHEFVKHALSMGELPLWDPTILCGVPFLASNPPTAFFYPLRFILYPFEYHTALNMYLFVHLFIAGASMFYFLKSYRLRATTCFFGGIAFMCSPYLVGRIPYLAEFTILSLAPLALLCTKTVCKTKSSRAVATGAAVYACMHFIGQPQLLYPLTVLMAFFWLDFLVRDIRRGIPLRQTPLLVFPGMLVLGTLMASIALIPFIEFVLQSDRAGGLSYSQFASRSLPLYELVGFLAPDPFGANSIDLLHPNWKGIQRCLTPYLGAVPLVLVGFSGKLTRPKYLVPVLFFLLWAVGGNWGWFEYFYRYFPGVRFTRIPERALLLVCLVLTIYSAFGFERFLDMVKSKRLKLPTFTAALGSLIFLSLGTMVFLLMKEEFALKISETMRMRLHATFLKTTVPNLGQTAFFFSLFSLAVALAAKGKFSERGLALILIVLTAINLFLISFVTQFITEKKYFYSVRDIWDSDLDAIKKALSPNSRIFLPFKKVDGIGFQLEAELMPNVGQIHGDILNAAGYNCQLIQRYRKLEKAIEESKSSKARILSLMAVQYYFSSKNEKGAFAWPIAYRTAEKATAQFEVRRNQVHLPRVRFVREYQVINSEDEILSALISQDFDPGRRVILEQEMPDFPTDSGGEVNAQILNLETSCNHIVIKIEADSDCLLILSDMYYPGWKAKVNGITTKIYRANLLFRAIRIPAGTGEVVFEYRPRSFHAGALISFLATSVCVAIFTRISRRRGSRNAMTF